jgi:polar amino acid transport system permease protein
MKSDLLWEALNAIASGVSTTLMLISITAVVGLTLSTLAAAAKRGGNRYLRAFVIAYVELIRNTPFLVQLFFIYFGLPALGIRFDPIHAALLAMIMNMTAYTTEIIAGGLDAVPQGQRDAAIALGLRPYAAFIKVILPQALIVIYPALASQIIIMMLESAVVSQIAVRELTHQADLWQARTFRAFETYFVVAMIYLVLAVTLRRLMVFIGRRFISAEIT